MVDSRSHRNRTGNGCILTVAAFGAEINRAVFLLDHLDIRKCHCHGNVFINQLHQPFCGSVTIRCLDCQDVALLQGEPCQGAAVEVGSRGL